jgi:hypothetical protein
MVSRHAMASQQYPVAFRSSVEGMAFDEVSAISTVEYHGRVVQLFRGAGVLFNRLHAGSWIGQNGIHLRVVTSRAREAGIADSK